MELAKQKLNQHSSVEGMDSQRMGVSHSTAIELCVCEITNKALDEPEF